MFRAVLAPLLLLGVAAVSCGGVLLVHQIERGGSPIGKPLVTAAFSPNGDGSRDVATLRFRLDAPDIVTVDIVDDDGRTVRTLIDERGERGRVLARWNGRDTSGRPTAEGVFHARIHLEKMGRTFDVQSPIVLDVTPPSIGGLELDVTRVTSLGRIRAQATDVRDSVERYLVLDGKILERQTVRRSARVRAARSYDRFFISATLPEGSTLQDAARVELRIVDRAGNQATRGGPVAAGPLRVPARGPSGRGDSARG